MSNVERLEDIGHAMMLAWGRIKKAQARMWGDWMTIGEGLLEGRRWAMQRAGTNRPEGRGYVVAFGEWLKRYRVDDMDKSDRAKLLQLMEERPGVEEWRSTLTDYERRNLNNPTIAWRKWTAATRVAKPKPRTAGISLSEHGRARATIEQLQARNEELEEERRVRPDPVPTLDEAIAVITDAMREMGFDEQQALLERIVTPLGMGVSVGSVPDSSGAKPKTGRRIRGRIPTAMMEGED